MVGVGPVPFPGDAINAQYAQSMRAAQQQGVIAENFSNDQKESTGFQTAGSFVGLAGGVIGGAALGATIGSAAGGVGAVPGAIMGGLAGAIIGPMAGNLLGKVAHSAKKVIGGTGIGALVGAGIGAGFAGPFGLIPGAVLGGAAGHMLLDGKKESTAPKYYPAQNPQSGYSGPVGYPGASQTGGPFDYSAGANIGGFINGGGSVVK